MFEGTDPKGWEKHPQPILAMLWAIAPGVAVLRVTSQDVNGNALAAASEPEFCGALWFLHIPKTGGDSVKQFLSTAAKKAQHTASAYKFVDLYDWEDCEREFPISQVFLSPNMSDWSASPIWRESWLKTSGLGSAACGAPHPLPRSACALGQYSPHTCAPNASGGTPARPDGFPKRFPNRREAEAELTQKERPRLVVHQHHCSAGLGAALLPQLERLDTWLKDSGHGCRVRIATVLRKPVAHMESSIYYNEVKRENVADFIKTQANSQSKYLLYGAEGHKKHAAREEAPPGLEESATAVLHGCELLGTTEQLPVFTARLASLLEVPVPQLEHVRCAHRAGGVAEARAEAARAI